MTMTKLFDIWSGELLTECKTGRDMPLEEFVEHAGGKWIDDSRFELDGRVYDSFEVYMED